SLLLLASCVAPPAVRPRLGSLEYDLFLGGGAGSPAGWGDERTAECKLRFARRDRIFVEARGGDIPMHGFEIFEAEFLGAECGVACPGFLHGRPSECSDGPNAGVSSYPSAASGRFRPRFR